MPDLLDTFLNAPPKDPLDTFLGAPEQDDLDRFLNPPERRDYPLVSPEQPTQQLPQQAPVAAPGPPPIEQDPLDLFLESHPAEQLFAPGIGIQDIPQGVPSLRPDVPTLPKEIISKASEKPEEPGLSDWAGAWWEGLTTPLRYGRDDPRTQAAMQRFQEIDAQTIRPIADKASQAASVIAVAIFAGQGAKAAHDAFRIAKSQFGDLSPTVKSVKRALSKILGGPESPIQQALDKKITPQQAAQKLGKFATLNPERTEQALNDLGALRDAVIAEKGIKGLPTLGVAPTALGPVVQVTGVPPAIPGAELAGIPPPPIPPVPGDVTGVPPSPPAIPTPIPEDVTTPPAAIPAAPIPSPVSPIPKSQFDPQRDSFSKWLQQQGGLSTKGEFRGEILAQFSIKELGGRYLNNKIGLTPDRMRATAVEAGWITDDVSTDEFLNLVYQDAVARKRKTETGKIFHPQKTFDEVVAPVIEEFKEIPAGELQVGDKFTIRGQEHEVVGENPEGNIIIKNDHEFEVDPFDQVPSDGGIESVVRAGEQPKTPKPFPEAPAPTPADETVLERIIRDETGGVSFEDLETIGLDAVKKANKLIEKIDVYSNVPDKVAENFIKFNQHYNTISKREGALVSFEMFKHYPKKLTDSLGKLFEHQKTAPLPADMVPLAEAVKTKQDNWKARLERLGINVATWPDNVIKNNLETIKSIDGKLRKLTIEKPGVRGLKARQKLIDARNKLLKSNRELAGLSYLKRFSLDPKRKFFGFRKKPLLTTPKEFFGRSYPTIEAAEAAGKEVLDLPEMVARAERIVLRTEHVHSLINSINRNPKFSVGEKMKKAHPELYKDWEMLPRDVLPSARKRVHPGIKAIIGENKFYHPTIARLFREVTYSPNASTWWKLNNALVSLIFYNPGIMTTNDVLQGLNLMGPRFFNLFRLGRAVKTVASYHKDFWPNLGPALEKVLNLTPEAAAKYKQYQDWGIYNKAISTGEAAEDLATNMLEALRASYPQKMVRIAERVLQHPIKSLRTMNDNTTWIIDEVLRTMGMDYALESGMFDKWGLSKFQKAKETNYAFGWYESVPRETRHAFRKGAFTATFKTAMYKRELRNYKNAFKLAEIEYAKDKGIKVPVPGPQFEQFVWGTFLKAFYRFALPAALLEYYRRKGFKDVKTKIERNYRIVVQNATKDGKEIAITPGGPILELNKLFNRPIGQSLFYQLPPALHTINTVIYGPKFKKWAREIGILSEVEPFLKFGIPLKRDIENWREQDKTTAEKFLQQMGLWYMYKRKPKKTSLEKEQEEHWLRETLNTLGLIPNEIMLKGLPRLIPPRSEEQILEELRKGLISKKEALQLRANLEVE